MADNKSVAAAKKSTSKGKKRVTGSGSYSGNI